MAEHFYSPILMQAKVMLSSQPLPVWIFEGMLLVSVLWGLWKLHRSDVKMGSREIKWAVLLALLVFPLNTLVHLSLFEGEILSADGRLLQPQLFLLGLIPAFAAVGLTGPLVAAVLALAAGMIQAFIFGEDPLLILLYGGLIVLVVWQTSRTETRGSQRSKNPPILNGLLAFVYFLPLLLLGQLIISLSFGERHLLLILERFLLEASTIFPAVLVAAGVSEALSRWDYADWNPFRYVQEQEVPSAINQAVAELEKMTLGKYDEELQLTPRSASEAKFYQALNALRENLRLRNDTQSRLLSLDPSYYSREAYDLLLASILRAALGRDGSSARLILFNPARDPDLKEMRLQLGQGDKTRVYAYLDVMILEKLGSQDQLILSDIKDDQYFGASAGLPYPQSLVALSLKNEGKSLGVLWVGFEQNHWFSEDDLHFYQQLAYRASAALSTKEQAVRMQTEKAWLEAAFQALADPILILDSVDEVVFANSGAQQLLAKDMGGAPSSLKDLQLIFPELGQTIKRPDSSSQPFHLVFDKSQEYEARVVLLNTKEGLSGKVLVLRDTAWQKRVTAQKSEFVANITHDLLSPLQLMRGYVNMLKNIGNLSEEQEKYVSRILLSIENMSGLVSKVMSMEMLDSSEGVKLAAFDIKSLIDGVVSTLDLQAQQRKVSIHTDYSGLRNPKVLADWTLLRQAVFNLVENAIKFNRLGGDVWISASRDAATLWIEVKDNGKGIAPLDQPRIFTRYFHVEDGENLDNPGPGLGLSIVKSIADKHGGKISVQSQLGEGSTFTLEIPIRK